MILINDYDPKPLYYQLKNIFGDLFIWKCASFELFYSMLLEFEEDSHQHIHLENNILFPTYGQAGKIYELPDKISKMQCVKHCIFYFLLQSLVLGVIHLRIEKYETP